MDIIKCDMSDRINSDKYILQDNEKQIGYGYIIDSEINPIDIFINEEERSNGYGELLFSQLLKIIKQDNKKPLIFEVKKTNYRISNIISKLGALHITTIEDKNRWVFPL